MLLPVLVFIADGLADSSVSGLIRLLPSVFRTLRFSLLQAAVSSIAALVAAFPGAYIFGRLSFRGKRILRSLTIVPFVLPGIIVVVSIVGVYGRSGLFANIFGVAVVDLYGVSGIVLAHVFYNISIPIRLVGEAWGRIPDAFADSARLDGADTMQVVFRIILPILRRAILASGLLVFLLSFSSFGIVLIFGGVRFATLEVRIYQELVSYSDKIDASAIAAIQLIFSAAALACFLAFNDSQRIEVSEGAAKSSLLSSLRSDKRVAIVGYLVLLSLFVAGPLVALAFRSFRGFGAIFGRFPSGVSFKDAVGVSLARVTTSSIGLAFVSGLFCMFVALGFAFRRRGRALSIFVQLPLGLSLVTFALGLFDLAPSEIPRVVVVVLVQSFLAFPFVYRILDTTFRDLDPSLLDVAATLGAGSFDIVKLIYFPLVRPGVASALAFAIAIPFADFTGVLVVGRGRIVTFPIAIYRLLGFRNFDSALALGTLYMALLFVVFFLVNGTERRQPGESTRFI